LQLGQSAQLEALGGAEPHWAQAGPYRPRAESHDRLVDADVAVSGTLLQGEAFRVRVELGRIEGWLVPRDAVLSDTDGAYAFRWRKARRCASRSSCLQRWRHSVVDGPVDPHRLLVTQGNYQLGDGMAVRQNGSAPESKIARQSGAGS